MTTPSFAHSKPLTKVSRVPDGKDVYGNAKFRDVSTVIPNCVWWPGGDGSGLTGAENTDSQEQVTSGYTVLLPVGTDIDAIDALTGIDGAARYEIEGDAARYEGNPLSTLNPGILVRVKRVTG